MRAVNTSPQFPPAPSQNVVYVTQASDLPAPSGGVITLDANTTYVFYNDDPTTSQKFVTLADRIAIPDAGGCRITSTGLAEVILVYSGTGNFLTTSDDYTGFLTVDHIFISAPNGTLFDFSGVLPVGSEFFPRVFFTSMGFFDTDTVGSIKNISFNYNIGAFFSCGDGLVLTNMNEALISDVRFIDWKNQVNAVMLTMKGVQTFPKIAGCIFKVGTNETLFDIQPNLPASDILVFAANGVDVGGTAFQTGTSGAFTAVADQSESGTTIDSVAGTAFGESLFTTAIAHGLVVGEEAIHTGFADSNYNGTFRVLEVISTTQYRVHTLFTATGTGSLASDIIEFTSTAHGLVEGDSVQLTDSTVAAYNVGGTVIDATANTFQINGVFSATATGNWNTDSLTQADPRVEFAGNSGLADSVDLAFGEMNANAVATVIAAVDTYQALDVSGLVDSSVTSRFELTDATDGIYTYRGAKSISAKITAIISATKSGGTQNYRFTTSKNGAIPVFASANYAPIEVKAAKVAATVGKFDTLVSGDTIQVMGAGDGTSDNLTITDFLLEVEG